MTLLPVLAAGQLPRWRPMSAPRPLGASLQSLDTMLPVKTWSGSTTPAKLAIHRLRPALPQERRAERLSSATPDDKRISSGCVVVPVSFYDAVISPVLGKSYAVVYVLPETQPVQFMLRGLQLSQRQDQ